MGEGRVVVVGAGVVGLCCAYELARRGLEVEVVERGEVGGGASRGNTGWISPSFSYPLPGPGVIGTGLRGLAAGGGPLAIHPTVDPTFVRWLWRFRAACSRAAWERGVRALLALNARTLDLFDDYAGGGVRFEMHDSGLVLVATSAHGLEEYLALFRELARLGFAGAIDEIDAARAVELEPALRRSALAGGAHARVDRHVRPESLTGGLAARLAALGVPVRRGVDVRGIRAAGLTSVEVVTAAGSIRAGRAVLAAGSASAALLADLGVRMPVVGARGYSVTVAGGETQPRHAVYLAEAKVGVSAFSGAVRLAGVFELGRPRAEVEARRVEAMLATVRPYFDRWRPDEERRALEWAGLRPMTADGLPLVGRSPRVDRAFIATGHGMLGVTLAPASASLLADLIVDGRRAPELEPFAPGR